jgi:transposase InsO family protein
MTTTPQHLIEVHQLEAYSKRKSVTDAFKKWEGSLKGFAALHQVPASTVKDWVAKSAMGTDNLLDKRMFGGRKVALPTTIAAWCFCYATDHPKASLTAIHDEVSKMAAKANLAPFSYKQVCLLFKRVPADMRRIIADGQRAGFEQAGIVARRQQFYPNQHWQMDATELDSWVLDMATGVWYHPWMTSVIDDCTRVTMAATYHRYEPTTADSLITLSNAILPKGTTDMPFYGLPETISTDNHAIYKSADFLDALRRLNITKVEIPDQCPSADGKIERYFHSFKYGLLTRLAGYAGQYRGLAKAKEAAVPDALLPKLIRRFMVEYHLREHREIATTPWEKWHDGLEHAHGLVVNPSEVEDAIKLRRDFKVARDGIQIEPGRHYTGACLAGLVDETITILVSPQGRDREVPAYYRLQHIGNLRCVEEDPTLADDIRAERLLRCIDIQRLASILRDRVPNPGVNAPVPGLPQDGPPPSTPAAPPTVPALPVFDTLPPLKSLIVPTDKPDAIGQIPSLQTDDDETQGG